jgi:hypothetical protein
MILHKSKSTTKPSQKTKLSQRPGQNKNQAKPFPTQPKFAGLPKSDIYLNIIGYCFIA